MKSEVAEASRTNQAGLAPRLFTIEQFVQRHPWASGGGVRWQRFNCKTNGFQSAFLTIGRKVLVDEDEYFRCVDQLNDRTRGYADGGSA